jgi:hypothetical protein
LADDAVHDAAAVALVAALGRDRVELVEEDDARASVARALEHAPHIGLGLADVHVEQLGPLDREEVERELGRDGLGEQRLARAGRPVEEDAAALLHALGEELRARQRQLDRLDDGVLDVLEAADVVPPDVRDLGRPDGIGEVLARSVDGAVKVRLDEA